MKRMVFVAGGCTNSGIIPEVEVPYDKSLELYRHLERSTEKVRKHYGE